MIESMRRQVRFKNELCELIRKYELTYDELLDCFEGIVPIDRGRGRRREAPETLSTTSFKVEDFRENQNS